MIIDTRLATASGTPRPDICIVGAGPAGIALALELESSGKQILLIEAGDLSYDVATQGLFEGEVIGDQYPPLRDTRLAALGGSTGVWAGFCRPLDASDFEPRGGSPGWPFGLDALGRCFSRAHQICCLGACEYDEHYWSTRIGHQPLIVDDPDIRSPIFHMNSQRFGTTYRQRLAASRNVELMLRAPVLRLQMDSSGERAERVVVRTLEGRDFGIEPGYVVLAAGGIENARLLLLSGKTPGQVPGNGSGLVGRYHTDHPFVDPGYLVLAQPLRGLDYYFPQPSPGGDSGAFVRGALSLRPESLVDDRMMNGAVLLYPPYECHDVYATPEVKALLEAHLKWFGRAVPGNSGRLVARALRRPDRVALAMLRKLTVGDRPVRRWRLRAMFESESLPENRVTLAERRDELDRPLARVEWRLSDRDLQSMSHFMQRLDAALRRHAIGHIELGLEDDPAHWRRAAVGGKHHMGTTRMHRDPRHGVVDADSRVHRTSNLFVAGSSVFPTGGFANPTLTIVALAVRLANHLRQLH